MRPNTTSSSIASVRAVPGSISVTTDPTCPHVTVNGPTDAGATSKSSGWHSDIEPAAVGSPGLLPTHTVYAPSVSWQQSERPWMTTLETNAPGTSCTESHGSTCAPLVWQKLQSDALPHAPSMQAWAEKS
eukprot:4023155-Prymnesium_polylepis.2